MGCVPGALDLAKLKGLMAGPVLVDLRNVYLRDESRAQASPIPRLSGELGDTTTKSVTLCSDDGNRRAP